LTRTPLFLASLLALGVTSTPSSADEAEKVILLKVPFYPDQTDQCGPATLASLLSYWGKPTDPVKLRQAMYDAKLKGSLPMDLVKAARDNGLSAEMVEGTPELIKSQVEAGRPVLVMLNMGLSALPIGHYVVVTGWDDKKKGFYAHSGGQADQFIAYKKFQKMQKTVDHWAMVAGLP
jgi:ABC-type bacteriocin/lantibiotic exporter with double-glycine peptidase domain